jgi:hypothetical protein
MMLDRPDDKQRARQKRARQARFRARQARGIACVSVELDESRFTKLARLGYARQGAVDPRELARAVEALLDSIEVA